jgi:hypothetical protein
MRLKDLGRLRSHEAKSGGQIKRGDAEDTAVITVKGVT